MTSSEPTVFLVDDDPSVLKAVGRLLRAEGLRVLPFNSPGEFIDHHDLDAHGCVVLDMAMPGINGLELQTSLIAKGVTMPILFLSGRADISSSVRAMKQGAIDFLTKPVDEGELVSAIRAALARDLVNREAKSEVAQIRQRLATLTPREYEVFEHVVSGRLNKQTASELGTAEKTIKVHRKRVMQKLNVVSLAELVRLAEHAGVASLPDFD